MEMFTSENICDGPYDCRRATRNVIKYGAAMKDNFYKSYKAGVKIAYGTDSGVSKHGTNAREAVLMVKAGIIS